jgi:hypothetical protein
MTDLSVLFIAGLAGFAVFLAVRFFPDLSQTVRTCEICARGRP